MAKIEAEEYGNRVEELRNRLCEEGLDAFVATALPSIRYLCGYAGREEVALVLTPSDLVLIVGKLHVEKEKELTVGTTVIEKDGTLPKTIAGVLKDDFPASIGIESKDVAVAKLADIRKDYDGGEYRAADTILEGMREIKSDAEVEAIRETIMCAESAFISALQRKPVKLNSEKEVAAQLDYLMKLGGADVISFPVRVAYGESCGKPHSMPGAKMAALGDTVMFDFGAVVDGYHSDVSRTGFVGAPSKFWAKVYDGVLGALTLLENSVKPGMKSSEVYGLAERELLRSLGSEIESEGGSYGLNFGHGIGVEEHEVPHLSAKSNDVVKAGQVICMEPSLYFVGKGCMHIEDMYLVTDSGVERLSTLPRQMQF